MGEIAHIPQSLINHLQSGVVLSDLAQIVEELICNSIDAGATKVCVRVNLKTNRIIVEDNGSGISRDNLAIVGERHATSKLHSMDELECGITTFGFRGEALSSLSDIAILELATRIQGSPHTYRKIMKGCKTLFMGLCSEQRSPGTTIIVRDLFYNLPVRRKVIISSPRKVLQSMREVLVQHALIHPDIYFSVTDLERDEKLLHCQPVASALDRFCEFFGEQFREVLVELKYGKENLTLTGYMSRPGHHFSTKAAQFIYVNSHFIHRTVIHKLLNSLFLSMWTSKNHDCFTPKDIPEDAKRIGTSKIDSTNKKAFPAFLLNLGCPQTIYDITFDVTKKAIQFKNWDNIAIFVKESFNAFLESASCTNKGGLNKQLQGSMDVRTCSRKRKPWQRIDPTYKPSHLLKSVYGDLNEVDAHEFQCVDEMLSGRQPAKDIGDELNIVCARTHNKSLTSRSQESELLPNKSYDVGETSFPSNNFDSYNLWDRKKTKHREAMMGKPYGTTGGGLEKRNTGHGICDYTTPKKTSSDGESVHPSSLSELQSKSAGNACFMKTRSQPCTLPINPNVTGSIPIKQRKSLNEVDIDLNIEGEVVEPEFSGYKSRPKRRPEYQNLKSIDAYKTSGVNVHTSEQSLCNFMTPFDNLWISPNSNDNKHKEWRQTTPYIDDDLEAERMVLGVESPRYEIGSPVNSFRSVRRCLDIEKFCSIPVSEPKLVPILDKVHGKWNPCKKKYHKEFNRAISGDDEAFSPLSRRGLVLSNLAEDALHIFSGDQGTSPKEDPHLIWEKKNRMSCLDFEHWFPLGNKDHISEFLDNSVLSSKPETSAKEKCHKDVLHGPFKMKEQYPVNRFGSSSSRLRRSHSAPPFDKPRKRFGLPATICSSYSTQKDGHVERRTCQDYEDAGDKKNITKCKQAGQLRSPQKSMVEDVVPQRIRQDEVVSHGSGLGCETAREVLKPRKEDEPLVADNKLWKPNLTDLYQDWKNPCFQVSDSEVISISSVCSDPYLKFLVPDSISKESLQNAHVLRQMGKKFIGAVAGQVLVLIDQHAADERIRLEQLRDKVLLNKKHITSVLDLPYELSAVVRDIQLLRTYRWHVESWGWRFKILPGTNNASSSMKRMETIEQGAFSVILSAVPCILGENLDDKCSLTEYLHQLEETDGSSAPPPAVLRLLASKACRGAIMFGDLLLKAECQRIVEELKQTSLCFQCAHGRPTTVPLVNLRTLHKLSGNQDFNNRYKQGKMPDSHNNAYTFKLTKMEEKHGLRWTRTTLKRAMERLEAS